MRVLGLGCSEGHGKAAIACVAFHANAWLKALAHHLLGVTTVQGICHYLQCSSHLPPWAVVGEVGVGGGRMPNGDVPMSHPWALWVTHGPNLPEVHACIWFACLLGVDLPRGAIQIQNAPATGGCDWPVAL
jgi:hypothetical protein